MLLRLFKYVEIKTKITSVFPFLLTLAYLKINDRDIDPLRTAVFFIGMLAFDLTATTINNYFDTKNNHQTLQFARRDAAIITCALLTVSTALGIWLVLLTDTVVLALGILCFVFGMLYSSGPVPISHGPYGELISGVFYGMVIPFILVYINAPGWILLLAHTSSWSSVTIVLATKPLISFLLMSLLPFCLTAGIMLANNICDLERDISVGRFTLVYYLRRRALTLFAMLYYTAYASVILMVILGYLPLTCLLILLTLIPVQKNLNLFRLRQIKEETFVVSIKNFLLIIVTQTVLILVGMLLPGW